MPMPLSRSDRNWPLTPNRRGSFEPSNQNYGNKKDENSEKSWVVNDDRHVMNGEERHENVEAEEFSQEKLVNTTSTQHIRMPRKAGMI